MLFSIFIIPRRAFQSTPSAWRETVAEVYFCLWLWYFNPLPPHGGRLGTQTEKNRSEVFQSTPSAWRETSDMRKCYHCIFISIHSLRMEGDVYMTIIYYNYIYFNPLPPHGGRPCKYTNSSNEIAISIHSLRMEGDAVARKENFSINRFQSTPSAWRETCYNTLKKSIQGISIHSLRMEGDLFSIVLSKSPNCISIHSLRMEGDVAVQIGHAAVSLSFQSTPSAWRETFPPFKSGDAFLISIHSLRMEGDH